MYIQQTTDPTCRANRITNRNIIFNKEIKLPSKNSRKLLQLLIRRDIYYRKVNHVPNNNEEVYSIRRKAHLRTRKNNLLS